MQHKSYITPHGYERLSSEYRRLKSVERPRVVEEVSRAAAMGDRSENAEYIYGKKRLREIDRRLGFLSKRMNQLQVIDPATIDKDVVSFGATVTVEYEDGKIVTYQIVGEDEVDVPKGRISYKSPVGRALLGKEVDDSVMIRRPAGPIEVTILELCYQAIE